MPTGEEFASNLNNLNAKAQAIVPTDSFRLNAKECPAGSKQSSKDDFVDSNKGQSYCIIVENFQVPSINPRYTPNTQADQPYFGMKSCADSHSALTTEMMTLTDA